jgi:hypothetical protein
LYNKLAEVWINRSFKYFWKAKIPPKIKIWLWLIWYNSVATKDNMTKRGWIGDTKCRFCEGEENIHHLFFLCPPAKYMWSMVSLSVGVEDIPENFAQYFAWIAKFATKKILTNIHVVGLEALCWELWKLTNRACFEKKLIRSSAEIICYACLFLRYWAGLKKEEDTKIILAGAGILQEKALMILVPHDHGCMRE